VGWELTPYPLAESNLGTAKIVFDRYSVPLLTWVVSYSVGQLRQPKSPVLRREAVALLLLAGNVYRMMKRRWAERKKFN
jgi:hypothetical protein